MLVSDGADVGRSAPSAASTCRVAARAGRRTISPGCQAGRRVDRAVPSRPSSPKTRDRRARPHRASHRAGKPSARSMADLEEVAQSVARSDGERVPQESTAPGHVDRPRSTLRHLGVAGVVDRLDRGAAARTAAAVECVAASERSASQMIQKASPPRPQLWPATTARAALVAMAASTALPPDRSVASPACGGQVMWAGDGSLTATHGAGRDDCGLGWLVTCPSCRHQTQLVRA